MATHQGQAPTCLVPPEYNPAPTLRTATAFRAALDCAATSLGTPMPGSTEVSNAMYLSQGPTQANRREG